jgi:hypothetical protein
VKKVRYAIGAVGVAPMVAVALPGAATAAVAHAPRTGAKAVSTQYVNQAVPAVGCTGHTEYNSVQGGFEYGFWYTRNGSHTCIGTVFASDQVKADSKWRIRIYSGPNHTQVVNHSLSRTATDYGVHKSLRDPVQLCWAKLKGGAVSIGPLCHTVG